jgi:predicted CXXCH cytochrome family protein
MTRTKTPSKALLRGLAAGLLVGVLSMGWVLAAATPAGAAAPKRPQAQEATPQPETTVEAAAPTMPPKECTECHPDIADAWTVSPHANAYSSQEFVERYHSAGSPGECLLCHTTGYQSSTGQFEAGGVTCKACHGEAVEGHPPAVVPVRSDADYCGTCHTTTHAEWRLTGHAAEQVGCTDCHNPHSQAPLFENPDELCLNCHKDDLATHQDDLHLEKGIGCVDCHALTLPPEVEPVDGLVPTGHSFTTTAQTCVACHTDALGIGRPLPGYEAGAKAVAAGETITSTLPALVSEYTAPTGAAISPEQQVQALEAALASSRLSMLFQGGIVGLVLGGTTAFFVARNGRQDEPETDGDTEDTGPDDEPAGQS